MENKNIPPFETGADKNVSAALSYVLGFVTGTYFFITSKNKFVRFHAMQSIITSLALWLVSYLIGFLSGMRDFISPLFGLASFVLWIFLIVKAYKGEKFKLPKIGDIAEQKA